MKPNVFKKTLPVLLTTVMLLATITNIQAHYPRYCGRLALYNKCSEHYLTIKNNVVSATSPKSHFFYSVNLNKSYMFYLYDLVTDRFICVKKRNRNKRLVPMEYPKNNSCAFVERPFEMTQIPEIQYVQPDNNFTMRFGKNGKQFTRMKKFRHKHAGNPKTMSAFLPVHDKGNKQHCDLWKHSFCAKMHGRSSKQKLPTDIRTFCKIRT